MTRKILEKFAPILDVILAPLTLASALLLRFVRVTGGFFFKGMPLSKKIFISVGIFPIRKHYHEPSFCFGKIEDTARTLPGINLNVKKQLKFIENFKYQKELQEILTRDNNQNRFNHSNETFHFADAEYYYNFIRYVKPKRIIEIGSGLSTLIALEAIEKNRTEDNNYRCQLTAIEPFENKWLENLNIKLIREKVEDLSLKVFRDLENNDVLFIDSSHIISPYGDVNFEYLEVLPCLRKGVYVHIHDIFTPYDYPKIWIKEGVNFFNEQYVLEALLTQNPNFQIVGSLNYLAKSHSKELGISHPSVKKFPKQMPGSFWIRKIS